eukprot:m.284201 g.284201  ORF g.284201 m.284201 type:complete len:199 (+) comp19900_c0_seq2:4646-5242(+)
MGVEATATSARFLPGNLDSNAPNAAEIGSFTTKPVILRALLPDARPTTLLTAWDPTGTSADHPSPAPTVSMLRVPRVAVPVRSPTAAPATGASLAPCVRSVRVPDSCGWEHVAADVRQARPPSYPRSILASDACVPLHRLPRAMLLRCRWHFLLYSLFSTVLQQSFRNSAVAIVVFMTVSHNCLDGILCGKTHRVRLH